MLQTRGYWVGRSHGPKTWSEEILWRWYKVKNISWYLGTDWNIINIQGGGIVFTNLEDREEKATLDKEMHHFNSVHKPKMDYSHCALLPWAARPLLREFEWKFLREYERAKKRDEGKKKNELRKKLSIDDAGVIREMNINEYEKNKARNYKTNIQFPTPISTLRSQRSSRSSRSSSAQPRSRSAYQR